MKGSDIINMFMDFYKEVKHAEIVERNIGGASDDETTAICVGIAATLSVNEILKNIIADMKA